MGGMMGMMMPGMGGMGAGLGGGMSGGGPKIGAGSPGAPGLLGSSGSPFGPGSRNPLTTQPNGMPAGQPGGGPQPGGAPMTPPGAGQGQGQPPGGAPSAGQGPLAKQSITPPQLGGLGAQKPPPGMGSSGIPPMGAQGGPMPQMRAGQPNPNAPMSPGSGPMPQTAPMGQQRAPQPQGGGLLPSAPMQNPNMPAAGARPMSGNVAQMQGAPPNAPGSNALWNSVDPKTYGPVQPQTMEQAAQDFAKPVTTPDGRMSMPMTGVPNPFSPGGVANPSASAGGLLPGAAAGQPLPGMAGGSSHGQVGGAAQRPAPLPGVAPAMATRVGQPAGAQGAGGAAGQAVGQSSDQMANYRNAIAGIESRNSGGYSAVNPKTGAAGRYQVMPNNIGPWTKAALGQSMTPQQFLQSPSAQDAVFNRQFGQSMQKYGNAQDAASVWFTGRPQAQGANARDAMGTTGNKYVEMFNKNLQPGGVGASAGGQKGFAQRALGAAGASAPAASSATPAAPPGPPQQPAATTGGDNSQSQKNPFQQALQGAGKAAQAWGKGAAGKSGAPNISAPPGQIPSPFIQDLAPNKTPPMPAVGQIVRHQGVAAMYQGGDPAAPSSWQTGK